MNGSLERHWQGESLRGKRRTESEVEVEAVAAAGAGAEIEAGDGAVEVAVEDADRRRLAAVGASIPWQGRW